MKRVLLTIAGILAGLYLAIMVLAWAFQDSLIFPAPQNVVATPSGYEEITLRTNDGLSLVSAFRAPQDGQPVALFFHGNGDNLSGASQAMAGIADAGFGVLLVEYRGYGGNPGSPGEPGFYRDGRAALAWLSRNGYSGKNIVLVGNSIGSGTAVQMAAEVDARAIILVSPLSSVPDVAASQASFLPVRLLLRHQFANKDKVGDLQIPILFQHGTEDHLVPISHSRTMAGIAQSASLEEFTSAGHELAYLPQAQAAQVAWLKSLAE